MLSIQTPELGYTKRINSQTIDDISLESVNLNRADIFIEGESLVIILENGGRIILEDAALKPELNIHLTPEIQLTAQEMIQTVDDFLPNVEPAAGHTSTSRMHDWLPQITQEVIDIPEINLVDEIPDLVENVRPLDENVLFDDLSNFTPSEPMTASAEVIPFPTQDTAVPETPAAPEETPEEVVEPAPAPAPVPEYSTPPEVSGLNLIKGNERNNNLKGKNKSDDDLRGHEGNDKLSGKGGDDILIGGEGRDILLGGAGDDTIYADAADKKILGGSGHDILIFEDNVVIDLSDRKKHNIHKIEEIDLNNGEADMITLSEKDVLRMNEDDSIFIRGEEIDIIHLASDGESLEVVYHDGHNYQHYKLDDADVYLELGMMVLDAF